MAEQVTLAHAGHEGEGMPHHCTTEKTIRKLRSAIGPNHLQPLEPRRLLAADVIITEIMHHPIPYEPGTEYIELHNRGDAPANLNGWRFSKGVDYTFGNAVLGAGDYLVVAGDLGRFQAKYPGVVNAVGGWTGRLSKSQEEIELRDSLGQSMDSVTYADEGDWADRRRGPLDRGHQGWVWTQPADGEGYSLELVNLRLTNNEGQNWRSSSVVNGTPGTPNSVAASDIPPMILDLRQTPIIPRSTEPVTITTRIIDELGTAKTAMLYYRVDAASPPPFASIAMRDDGAGSDAVAGDGTWTGVLPPQADRAVVEFYVWASDGTNTRTWPGPTDAGGAIQGANLLYQVDNSTYTGTQPVYRIIMTEAERAELADIGSDPGDGVSEEDSGAQMNATFISADSVSTQIRYNAGVRNRGHGTRHGPPNNFRVNIPSDRTWNDLGALNFNCRYTPSQVIGSAVYRMAGLAASDTLPVQLRVNGADLAAGQANMYGSYALVEETNSDFADNHFPQDSQGNLYSAFRLDPAGVPEADLRYEGNNPGTYRNRYFKDTNTEADDFSDLIHMTDVLNNTPDATYLQEVSKVINVEQWLRYLAVDALLLNWETGLDRGIGDDYTLYRGVKDPRFVLLPRDLDTVMGQGNSVPATTTSIFNFTGVDGLSRFLNHPDIVPLFYQAFIDAIDATFNPQVLNPLIDQMLGGWAAADRIVSVKKFVVDRTRDVLLQIPRQFTIASSLPMVSGFCRTTTATATLTGTADVVRTRSVRVNGQVAAWSGRAGTWSADGISLNPGINRVLVRAYDGPGGAGAAVHEGFIDILYDGSGVPWAPPQPQVQSLGLFVPDSYRPGTPILIQVSAIDSAGHVQRDLWNANVALATDRADIALSTTQVTLRNGLGSVLANVTGTGTGSFTITATLGTVKATRTLASLAGAAIANVSGTLSGVSTTWAGIIHVIGDLRIPVGHILTLQPGTLVLIDGVASGDTGIDIDVEGSIQSLGSTDHPVVFTAYDPARRWGEIHHNNAAASLYQNTILTLAGNSPRGGHSNTGPLIRTNNSKITFDHAALTDNAGKIMQADNSDLTFLNAHFARSVMGPEIAGSSLLFQDSFIFEMRNPDDGDGIYIHSQKAGQTVLLKGGMIGLVDDDGIDTLASTVTIDDVIIRDTKDKGLSAYDGTVYVKGSLFVDNGLVPEDGASTAISAKSNAGSIATVNIDHTTIVSATIGIQAKDKYNTDNDTVNYVVTNSIISATDPIQIDPTYPITANFAITYTNTFGENVTGQGNLNTDPLFADRTKYNFYLQPGSPSVNAGNPASPHDPDGSRADQGRYLNGLAGAISGPTIPGGTISNDMILTPGGGPYHVTGVVQVGLGKTLTILPGTTLFFDANAGITIDGGRLLAEGAEYAQIRFTRTIGITNPWAGIQLLNSMLDNRITYAIVEYGGLTTNNGMVGLTASNLVLDHVTFDHTDRRRVRSEDSWLIVRNSLFTEIFPGTQAPTTDNLSEHIWGSGIPAGGHFIIESNVFGAVKGHNDAIDFDTAAGTVPIPQILNNRFEGSGDDALDFETDAYIEGNTFLHIRKDQYNTAAGNSNAMSLGSGRNYTVLRNVFFDMDHIAQVKDNAFLTFESNSVVGAAHPAIYFFRPDGAGTHGRGAALDGNIFKDVPVLFASFTAQTQITVNRSIVPAADLSRGVGNLAADPRLVDPANGDFALRPGSPARDAGPNGLDMGAIVPAGASVFGEPPALTNRSVASLSVAGPGITHYKYRVNTGPWSAERPISTLIELTDLADGDYTVDVLGKNVAGVLQDESHAAASRTWTVNAARSGLRINEVLAINNTAVAYNGDYPDLIELYYDGPGPIELAGMSISDDPLDPRKFVFGSATLNPGQYLVLLADNGGGIDAIHLGFALSASGEGVYLFDPDGNPIDSIAFGRQIPDLSIGRLLDGRWALTQPTFGSANTAQRTGDPSLLKVNEWLASEVPPFNNDFIEIYNPDPLPVELSGHYLTDNPNGWPDRYPIPALSFVSAAGFVVFQADSDPEQGADHTSFRLAYEQGMIGLFDRDGDRIDTVLYRSQRLGSSEGRAPDGAGAFVFFTQPSPGVSNPYTSSETQVVHLISIDADQWFYNSTAAFTNDAWAQSAAGEAGWSSGGRAAFYTDNDAFPAGIPRNTKLGVNRTTHYFRKHFTVDDPAQVVSLTLSTAVDDGAVVYLNGHPVQWVAMAQGTVTYSTLSNRPGSWETTLEGPFTIDKSYLVPGDNVLAVEVHQKSGSNDAGFAVILDSTIRTAPPPPPLRITEINYNPPGGDDYQFVEVSNTGATPVNLKDVRFAAGISFTFPDINLAPGERIAVVKNPAAFAARYGSGIRIAGPYIDALSNDGEELRLIDAAGTIIQDFGYSDTWYPWTDGGGYTLVIVNPYADPSTWSSAASWGQSRFVLGSPGMAEPQMLADTVVINEVLSHSHASAADWIELYNTTRQPIDIGGWYLSDSADNLRRFRIPAGASIAADGYVVFDEAEHFGNAANPNSIVPFALSEFGDEVYLSAADSAGNLTGYRHRVVFGAAATGVSFGRFTTSTGLVESPALSFSTPAEPNAYPLVGPVVISEIMYHPFDNNGAEYVELRNITGVPVPLFDTLHLQNNWRFSGGIDFAFPPGRVIPAFGYVLVVSVDPADFRSAYSVPATVPVFGPFANGSALSDGGEEIVLSRPGGPDSDGTIPWIVVDRVDYGPTTPWPANPDGGGPSLVRPFLVRYGNDPAAWVTGPASGSPGAGPEVLLGTSSHDDYQLIRDAGGAIQLSFKGQPISIPALENESVALNALDGDDEFRVDFSNGNPIPAAGFLFAGGEGDDLLKIVGTSSGDNFLVSDAQLTSGGRSIGFGGTRIELGEAGDVAELGDLTLAGAATVALDRDGGTMLKLRKLSIAPLATLDLADNTLIVQTSPETQSADLARLSAYIKSGRANGAWTGPGLISTMAKSRPFAGLALLAAAESIRVKYTWNGDANLDGVVNADDYFQTDSGFITQKGGWYNGDFNYDSVVNADDYFLIDSAFIGQSGPLAASRPDSAVSADVAVQQKANKADPDGILSQLFSTKPLL